MADETTDITITPLVLTFPAYPGEDVTQRSEVEPADAAIFLQRSDGADWYTAEVRDFYDSERVQHKYIEVTVLSGNGTGAVREDLIGVLNGKMVVARLTVRQWAADAYITLTPATLPSFPAEGGTAEITVNSSTGEFSFRVDSIPDWLTVTVAVGTTSVRLVVAENAGSVSRSANLLIYNEQGAEVSYPVEQDAPPVLEWKPAHSGEFLDIRGNTWRAEILRLTTDEVTPSELEFPADSPLVIEWPSSAFEDAVWGSSATLKVISPGDRTYIDLYTVEPGTIRLDVYKNGSPYWSGALDPEFYEEPYERLRGYEVSLTFTDFGILDRLEYDLEGVQGLRDIINAAIEKMGINVSRYINYAWTGIRFGSERSTQKNDLFENTTGIAVRSDNFTDEEGGTMTFMEVLEGVLQPLGLKMVQRGGYVRLFDPVGLREWFAESGDDIPAVVWAGDSQTLGVDRVYNKVAVTFSPYAPGELLEDAVSFGAEVSADDYAPGADGASRSGVRYWTFLDSGGGRDFNLYLSADGSGVTFGQGPLSEYFHILPIFGGADECTGVPYFFCTEGDAYIGTSFGWKPCAASTSYSGDWAFTAPRVYVRGDTTYRWLLRVVMEILVDCRHDPFDTDNEDTYQERLEGSSAFVFLSARVRLYDAAEGGNVLYHLENALAADYGRTDLEIGMRKWVEGSRDSDDVISAPFWFEWYNPDDLTDNSGGAGGWKANRHNIGRPDGAGRVTAERVSSRLRNAPDGEFFPLPPVSGWLEILVGDDLTGFKYGDSKALKYMSDSDTWGDEGVRDHLTWFLLKCPEVHIVRNDTLFTEGTADDVEYAGALAAGAADELDIDTVCGTADGVPPTARGLYIRKYYDAQPTEMYRGGVTARPEELLIGSLYSQYAGRKAVITGEAEIPESLLLTEDNQEGKTFLLTADSQNIRAATSDIEIRELGEDTYTPE